MLPGCFERTLVVGYFRDSYLAVKEIKRPAVKITELTFLTLVIEYLVWLPLVSAYAKVSIDKRINGSRCSS